MNPNKKDKLQTQIRALSAELAETSRKAQIHYDVAASLVKMVKDIDMRLGAALELLTNKSFTEAELEAKIDEKRGIRLLNVDDTIKDGDLVWVDFLAKVEGEPDVEQKGCILHIGSKAAVFEEALIGKKVGEKVPYTVSVPIEGKDPKLVSFDVQINRAKTKTRVPDVINPDAEPKPEQPAEPAAGASAGGGSNPKVGGGDQPNDQPN